MKEYYLMHTNDVLSDLETNEWGLAKWDAQEKLASFWPNKIESKQSKNWWATIIAQFKDLMIIILIISAWLSRYLWEWKSAIVLIAIVIFNAVVGFLQEYKADRIMNSLSSLVHPFATARRDEEWIQVTVEELVPGDIVKVQEWEAVPADMRVIEGKSLTSNDFALTGESNPVKKFSQQLHHPAELWDRNNMIFMGTTVAHGTGIGIVVGTGKETVLWQIASLSQTTKQDLSPLQKELTNLSKKLSINVLVVGVVLFFVALLIDLSIYESFLFALGICMSLVPQGMPAQISVALSLASSRLAKKQVVVKKLSSVETLGSTTIICTDKTWTLTKNQMTVQEIYIAGQVYSISGTWYKPQGQIIATDGLRVDHSRVEERELFFKTWILASTARIAKPDDYHKTWYTLWDPTEWALITLAEKAWFDQEKVEQIHKEQKMLPFDSVRKRMSSIRVFWDRTYLLVKWAPDSVLARATQIAYGEKIAKISLEDVEKIHGQDANRAHQARRNLAVAYRDVTDLDWTTMTDEEIESDLIFLGLVSMIDPPREEVAEAMKKSKEAGINIAIITGDYALTAQAIAIKIWLGDRDSITTITGAELKEMDDDRVYTTIQKGNVIFSRTSPQDKLRIVSLLKERGEVVAVTGDGINDAPALKKADIGVSMWLTGTDVSKDASELVLLKDNFSHLINAIQEGRLIFQNLRKTILSSLTSNGWELFIVLISLLATGIRWWPIAITPILILSMDLIGEMWPLTALTWDKDAKGLMHTKPRDINEHVLNKNTLPDIIRAGLLMGILTYAGFALHLFLQWNGFLADGLNEDQYWLAVTVSYLTLLFCQYANIIVRRVWNETVFQQYTLTNRKFWISIVVSLILVACLMYIPALANMVGSWPISWVDRLIAIGGWVIFLLIREGQKKLS